MRRILHAVVALAMLAGACSGPGSDDAFDLVDGSLQRQQDGEWAATSTITMGDRIRSDEGARLERGDTTVWLLAGMEGSLDNGGLTVDIGDGVVDGSDLTLRSGDATVAGIGAVRMTAGVTPRVGVYTGTAVVTRPGEEQRVAPLRQVALSSRRFDGTDAPLSYDAVDPVDQQYLSRAITFDGEVARYTTRLNELYGVGLQPPSFYATFVEVADAEVPTLTASAPNRDANGAVGPPADALIGLFVARALAGDDPTNLAAAAQRIAELRAQGARWGLIAMALELGTVSFGATVDRAVAVRAATAPAPPPPTTPTAPGPPAQPVDPGPVPVPPSGPAPPPPPAVPPPPAPPPEDPGPVQELLDEVLPAVPALLSSLLGE